MRSLLLTSSALFILAGGAALAHSSDPSTIITTQIPVVKNSLAAAGSSSATSGGTSTNKSNNTTASNNTTQIPIKNSYADSGSSSATSGSTALTADHNTLTFVSERSLSVEKTNTQLNVLSGNYGHVDDTSVTVGYNGKSDGYDKKSTGGSLSTGNVSMTSSLNGTNGVMIAQQNSGIGSLQQNSVSIGAQWGNGTIGH